MKKFLLPLAVASALMVSCEKPENNEPDPEPQQKPEYAISVSAAELTFGAEGGTQSIIVTSTYGEGGYSWKIDGEYGYGWCEISAPNGDNGEEVIFTVDPYDNPDEARTATFTFCCGNKATVLTIMQEAKLYSVSAEPAELTFDLQGGNAEVTITSSESWEISSAPDWVGISRLSGESGGTVTVTTEHNEEIGPRFGEIVFTCGNKEAKVTITQKADDSPIIQFKDRYFLDALLPTYNVTWNDTTYYVNIDKNKDGCISEYEASIVEVLNLQYASGTEHSIRNADELSYFTNLRYLNIADQSLESLDLTNLPQLEYLDATYTTKSLNVSKCSALTVLYCALNELTSLDVSNNTNLVYLDCHINKLTSLDVSNNTNLVYLGCSNNQLTSLDISNNTALTHLYCYSNQLTSIDISNNTDLTLLNCSTNKLHSLDISNNTDLTLLSCENNLLTSLDVSKNTALTYLQCSQNLLTSLNVYYNRSLQSLYCWNNPLEELILYRFHAISYSHIQRLEAEYGDIINYME